MGWTENQRFNVRRTFTWGNYFLVASLLHNLKCPSVCYYPWSLVSKMMEWWETRISWLLFRIEVCRFLWFLSIYSINHLSVGLYKWMNWILIDEFAIWFFSVKIWLIYEYLLSVRLSIGLQKALVCIMYIYNANFSATI